MARRSATPAPDAGRRRFLEHSAALLGVSLLPIHWPMVARAVEAAGQAITAGASFSNLDAAEAVDLEAIAARIIPSGDTPGAREAGVIHFIDQAMGDFMAPALDGLRAGLAELNQRVAEGDGTDRFAGLAPEAQDAVLTEIQESRFFGLVRFLTIAGFLCLPSQGGNRDGVGWKLLGFDHRHAWQPPFGYYDAPVHDQPFGDRHHD